MSQTTLTAAIDFVQDVQVICFAIIFVAMAVRDRADRSLRWLAAVFLCGAAGALPQLFADSLPQGLPDGLHMTGSILAYACVHACIVQFTGRARRSRWVSVFLVVAASPFLIAWNVQLRYGAAVTLQDLVLGVQLALSAGLLLSSRDKETRMPQRLMAGFFCVYSLVEFMRATVYLRQGQIPELVSPLLTIASGVTYVVALSVMPLAFIWMVNRRLYARLQRESLSDPLTGIFNRRGLQSAGQRELARYQRFGQGFAVVLVDIDHFKKLNDTFGHPGGDEVLSAVAHMLHSMMRESDTAGRLGGEEFVLILTGTGPEASQRMAERIRLAIEQHIFIATERPVRLTASFGITHSRGRREIDWDKLLHEADIALYTAKREGRNCLRFYTDLFATTGGRPRDNVHHLGIAR